MFLVFSNTFSVKTFIEHTPLVSNLGQRPTGWEENNEVIHTRV